MRYWRVSGGGYTKHSNVKVCVSLLVACCPLTGSVPSCTEFQNPAGLESVWLTTLQVDLTTKTRVQLVSKTWIKRLRCLGCIPQHNLPFAASACSDALQQAHMHQLCEVARWYWCEVARWYWSMIMKQKRVERKYFARWYWSMIMKQKSVERNIPISEK